MKTTKKRLGSVIIMGVFTAYLAVSGLLNCRIVKWPLYNLLSGKSDFSAFTQQIQNNYPTGLAEKDAYVNLNGALSAALGQTLCNEVIKLNNGMLGAECPPSHDDLLESSKDIIAFNDFLDAQEIRHLYLQTPVKMDFEKTLLPEGVENYENENADFLLSLLADAGLPILDLRPTISATPELIEKYYFKTDHHWNLDGAFAGFRTIVEELRRRYPDLVRDTSWADLSKWEPHLLKNWFLGSSGRRVGIYFGGTDDFVYYTPEGDSAANISCAMPANGEFQDAVYRQGSFSDALIFEAQISPRDYFNANPYGVYLYMDHPMVQVRNPDAPNPSRVLFINNSFALPLIAYFSTLFQEVDAIDPRHYTGSIPNYVQFTHPDVVIQISSFPFDEESGIREPSAWTDIPLRETVETLEEGYASLPVSLTSGKSYVLEFADLEFLSGDSRAASIALYDARSSKVVDSAIFNLAYDRDHGGFSWCFTVPADVAGELELRFCAGGPEDMADHTAVYRGVRLRAVN